MADIGYLLVGHGTRNESGQQQFRDLFRQFAELSTEVPVELAFLELADPDISAGIRDLKRRGIKKVITVPVLLFSAGHALQDIPLAVQSACLEEGLEVLAQASVLGLTRQILELSALRFRQKICENEGILPRVGCSKNCVADGVCKGVLCPNVGLLMIGRGSRSDEATRQMLEFTRLRQELTPTKWHQTGFIHGQTPNVEEALDQLEHSGVELAVVQPHLLFEGDLINDLRVKVAQRQERNPEQKWVIIDTLGADISLAQTLLQLAQLSLAAKQSC